jgi:hypothetical protein
VKILSQLHRWIHPGDAKISAEAIKNLMPRLPTTYPSLVWLGDHSYGWEKRLIHVDHVSETGTPGNYQNDCTATL